MWWNDSWFAPWMYFGPVMMIVFIVICAAVMFVMMRACMGQHRSGDHALDILRERYARGEINQAEYEDRRRLLGA